MRLGRPITITDGVFQIRVLGARVTVLMQNGAAILVDAGLWGSQGLILNGLESLGLSRKDLRMVVVTHAHPDHSGGLGGLVQETGISVGAHKLEADIIEGRVMPPSPLQSQLVGRITQPAFSKLMGAPVPVNERLEEGDVIPFGTEVRVVHMPGHTVGSIALHLPREKTIIVGDALQYKLARRLTPPASGVTQDPQMAMSSLEKLLDLEFDTICFSHFPPMRMGGALALRALLRQRSSEGCFTARGSAA